MVEQDRQAEQRKKEHEREYIYRRLVEYPVADVISAFGAGNDGAEADESWFYLSVPPGTDPTALVRNLYTQGRTTYFYRYRNDGRSSRLVSFVPSEATFYMNEDHDLVKAHGDDGRARVLLEDLATAEVLLEVYLRETNVPADMVGQVLERRDLLLRSLAQDHFFSLDAISSFIRDSVSDEHDLEVGLIAAARALGFVATHVSGSGEPDGVAEFVDYASGKKKITLEAKSSQKVPSLSAIDFGGLLEHKSKYGAQGCLLVAPSYPGSSVEDNAAAERAKLLQISCWTAKDLARVVEAAERRQFSASTVLDIVLNQFAPDDVHQAVDRLFAEPTWDVRALYQGVLEALRSLEGRLQDTVRTTDHIEAEVSRMPSFGAIRKEQVDQAVKELAHASQGLLIVSGRRVLINGSLDEIERRTAGLVGGPGAPRRKGAFRKGSFSRHRS
jgi:hypothetical protein